MLGQNGKPSIHKLNVYPIDQQRRLPQLDQRTESPLARAPAAPCVNHRQNRQQQAHANQEEIRAGMPEVIDGINSRGPRIHPSCQIDQAHSACAGRSRKPPLPAAAPNRSAEGTRRRDRRRQMPSRERWGKATTAAGPDYARRRYTTRSAKAAIVGATWSIAAGSAGKSAERLRPPSAREPGTGGPGQPEHDPAHSAHQHHGDANGIQDVHPQQVAPGGPAPGQDVLLQTEQKPQRQNLRAAPDGLVGDRIRRQPFFGAVCRSPGQRKFPPERETAAPASVPPSWDHMKNVVFRAPALSQES